MASRNESHAVRIVLCAALVILGGLLAYTKLFPKKQERPKAWDTQVAEPAAPIPPDRFEQPDWLGGPELNLVGDLNQYGLDAFEVADAADSTIEARFHAAIEKRGVSPPKAAFVETSITGKSIRDEYAKYRRRERDAYEQLTTDPPEIKAAGIAFLDSYLSGFDTQQSGAPIEQRLERADAALEAGSQDPLIRAYATYLIWSQRRSDQQAVEQVMEESLRVLPATQYPRVVQMQIRRWLWSIAKVHGVPLPDRRFGPVVVSVVRWLEEDSRDPALRPVLWHRLSNLLAELNGEQRALLISALFQSRELDPWFAHVLAGLHFFNDTYRRVEIYNPRYGSNGFPTDLTRARAHLRYAWSLAPEMPQAAENLILLEAATDWKGKDLPRSEVHRSPQKRAEIHGWFLMASAAQHDYAPPYLCYRESICSWRGGSIGDIREFIRSCIETGRFDTQIPYLAVDFLRELEHTELRAVDQTLASVNAAELMQRFLELRADFRQRNPEIKLVGDNPHYQTRVAVLLSQLGMFADSVAEAQSISGDYDSVVLQEAGLPQQFLWNMMAAASGPVRDRVVAFDQKLRTPWTTEMPESRLDELEQELQQLGSVVESGNEWGRRYLADAAEMLAQLRRFAAGEWVTLPIQSPQAAIEFVPDLRRNLPPPATSSAHLRILTPFAPPLLVEARVTLNPEADQSSAGFGWRQQGMPWGARSSEQIGWNVYTVIENDRRVVYYAFSIGSSEKSGSTGEKISPASEYHLQWRVWNDAFEGLVNDTICQIRPRDPLNTDRGNLVIGPFARKHAGEGAPTGGWVGPFSELRVRRLKALSPPDEQAPPEQREAYWTTRIANEPDDDFAVLSLARLRLEHERFDEAIELTDRLGPPKIRLRGIATVKGLALFRLRRYAEARNALIAAEQEGGIPDGHALAALAEIYAAAPDESLRDLDRANQLVAGVRGYDTQGAGDAALGVTYALRGHFEEALVANKTAIEKATGASKADYEQRQKLYGDRQMFVLPQ